MRAIVPASWTKQATVPAAMRGPVCPALVTSAAAFGALVGMTAGARDARAQETPPPPVTVAWSAPAGCPERADVDAAIATLLRRSTKEGPHVDAQVVVVRAPGDRYRAEVHTRSEGHDGRRTFQASTCRSLADATALLLALMIDPSVAPPANESPALSPLSPSPPPPAPAPPDEASPARTPAPNVPPAAVPARSWSLSPRGQVGAILDARTLPGPQLGVEAALGVDYGPLLFALAGAYWPSKSYADVGNGVAGSLSLVDVRLSVCARPLAIAASTFPLWLCVGPSYEHLSADLPTLPDAHPSSGFGAIVGGLAVEPRVGIFGLQIRTDLAVPFHRQTFADESAGTIFTPGPAAFRGSVAVVVHFP